MNSRRLFTFGCSFTSYFWPTWADIAGKSFDVFENWGQAGGGNSFIFYSLCEAIKRNAFNSDDTVAIMWTSLSREDRWTQSDGWITVGSIYNQEVYNKEFVRQFADPTGYLIRDLALVSAAKLMLDHIGCRWKFFSMVPLNYHDDSDDKSACFFNPDHKVINLYKDVIVDIEPSVYEVVFNNDWYSKPGQVDILDVKRQYEICRGKDWPTWNDFRITGVSTCGQDIKKEILEDFQFKKSLIRTDPHPTPLEHCDYLQKVWPEIQFDRDWVEQIDSMVVRKQKIDSVWQRQDPVNRF